MFERYTGGARRTLFLGGQLALSLGRTTINPDDLLVGLLRDPAEPAKTLLAQLKLSATDIEAQLGYQHVAVLPASGPSHFRFTASAQRALQHAAQEADTLRHAHVGWEHLLIGIIREGSSVSASVLAR